MNTLTNDQKEVLKEIPGYIRRELLFDHITDMAYKPGDIARTPKDDYKRGFNTALNIIRYKMEAGVI